MESKMNHQGEVGTTMGLLCTVLLYFIARFTITEWAGIATVLSAAVNIAFVIRKWNVFNKKNKTPES